ncbi:MAG: hypothetical protein A3E36_01420 [Candidatus Andersenbacteria bacterium RIFCSPHIGHO2_12_FULL_45_11b]|uniref:Uncharacterized protein n=1 Tax=Candidatus Andersenbacteria bacterium RIFCSPHIGHO2_12_FULL_45_11b TaxID=1797282 RepID=A0A1G1X8N9_9BACT|nr:MAG: hypothetical protein A3E36_01420 [Candidatus Andersenbacteria bacterium RIFCSPHIGHO2_12_FULL_45_11b]
MLDKLLRIASIICLALMSICFGATLLALQGQWSSAYFIFGAIAYYALVAYLCCEIVQTLWSKS